MIKKENHVGLVLTLIGIFAINVIGIWCAYKFGYHWNSETENDIKRINQNNKENTSNIVRIIDNKSNISTEAIAPTKILPEPTVNPNITKDVTKPQLQGRVQFLTDTAYIENQSLETLKQIAREIKQYQSEKVNIRIHTNSGKSKFSQTIAEKRGKEIAGFIRHLGLKHKIIISQKSTAKLSKNLSPQQQRNQPIEIHLYPRK
ncbi:MAG: hypothetical protein AAF378_10730 [Cyanobacteria bacterium P01_A01_bin.84]